MITLPPLDETVHVLSGAYALDALDPGERRRFETHLRTCRACSIEVGEFQAVAALLGEGSGALPPPDLRGRVLQGATPRRRGWLRRVFAPA